MGLDYKALRQDVTRILKDFGQPLRLVRSKNPVANPVAGTVSDSGDVTYSIVGVITNYDARVIDGDLIRSEDKEAYVQAFVEPQAGDTLVEATGREWAVVNFNSIEPAGISVLYTLQLRR